MLLLDADADEDATEVANATAAAATVTLGLFALLSLCTVNGLFGRLDVFSLALPLAGVVLLRFARSPMCANEPRRVLAFFKPDFILTRSPPAGAGIELETEVDPALSIDWSSDVSSCSNAAPASCSSAVAAPLTAAAAAAAATEAEMAPVVRAVAKAPGTGFATTGVGACLRRGVGEIVLADVGAAAAGAGMSVVGCVG